MFLYKRTNFKYCAFKTLHHHVLKGSTFVTQQKKQSHLRMWYSIDLQVLLAYDQGSLVHLGRLVQPPVSSQRPCVGVKTHPEE